MTFYDKIKEVLFENLPKGINVRIEFEGPYLSIYTDNIALVTGETGLAPKLAKQLRKKILIRPLESIRLEKEKVKEIIKNVVPKEALLDESMIIFDDIRGEVHLYALRPSLIRGRGDVGLWELTSKTGWKIILHRKPPIESEIMKTVDTYTFSKLELQYKEAINIGMRINRELLTESIGSIRITPLGAASEVGRSCFLITTDTSNILLDAGLKPGAKSMSEEFPAFYLVDNLIDKLDAVIISHAHFDHCSALPYLFKYGYRGPVYMTEPTKYLSALIISDYLNISQKEGRPLPYTFSDLTNALIHTITLDYGEVVDIAPNVKLTLYNAGHILGSSIVHLHFGEGYHNLVYTGDFKYAKTRLLDQAFNQFKRNETIIMEGTYGGPDDIMPNRTEASEQLLEMIRNTIEKGGKVLMPMLAVGRAQEILLTIFEGMENNLLPKVPVLVEGMIHETTAIHMAFLEELSYEVREKVFKEGINPFTSEYFNLIRDAADRREIVEAGPCIIIATSGMLTGGPAVEYFKLLAADEKNSVIFTSFQVENTPGRKIKDGAKEIYLPGEKSEPVPVRLKVYSAEGFSGHSDRVQLVNYIKNLPSKPKNIILCHGESSKLYNLSQTIRKELHIPTYVPEIGETIKIK